MVSMNDYMNFGQGFGTASAADVAEVIREVQERVKDKFGVSLETEVIFLGDF